jgi:hypothetical protein
MWEPGSRRWLVTRHRIGPVSRALEQETDPLFSAGRDVAGLSVLAPTRIAHSRSQKPLYTARRTTDQSQLPLQVGTVAAGRSYPLIVRLLKHVALTLHARPDSGTNGGRPRDRGNDPPPGSGCVLETDRLSGGGTARPDVGFVFFRRMIAIDGWIVSATSRTKEQGGHDQRDLEQFQCANVRPPASDCSPGHDASQAGSRQPRKGMGATAAAATERHAASIHRGLMCEPPTMNSVSREPQLPQRHFICTSGTSPRPAAIRAARSASLA